MMKKVALLITLFLILLATQSLAESVKIVTLNWGSYVGENLKENGIHAAIVREAFKRAGKDVEFKFYPWKRAYEMATVGEAFLISASDSEERRQKFFYSEPYDNAASFLIGLRKNNFVYDGNLQGLKEYTIGVLRGHYLVKMLQDAGINNIEEVANDVQNLRKLFVGRIDFVAMSKIPAISIIENDIKKDLDLHVTLDQVMFFAPPLSVNPVYLIGHKDMPKSQKIIEEFNAGLKQIREDGTCDTILKRFGF